MVESWNELRGAATSFHSSNSRLPCGCVSNSYARMSVRRSAHAGADAHSANPRLIVILILMSPPQSVLIPSPALDVGWSAPALPFLAVPAKAVQLELVPGHVEPVVARHHV